MVFFRFFRVLFTDVSTQRRIRRQESKGKRAKTGLPEPVWFLHDHDGGSSDGGRSGTGGGSGAVTYLPLLLVALHSLYFTIYFIATATACQTGSIPDHVDNC